MGRDETLSGCVWLARVQTHTSLMFRRHAFVRHTLQRLALSQIERQMKGKRDQSISNTAVSLLVYLEL